MTVISSTKNTIPAPSPIILNLGPDFYDQVSPASFPEQKLRYKNEILLKNLGFPQASDFLAKHFWKFEPLPGNLPSPLALRYHGHQFMHYNPELGDGRGFLFAQIEFQNRYFDFGTKGSGQTPYSRRGDGRLTLKGAFREALATEMLKALGVHTSETFTFFETGEALHRGDEPSPTRSAVLTRFTHGHLRIGTFQRLYYLEEKENLIRLIRYANKYYVTQEIGESPSEDLNEICDRLFKYSVFQNASLAAQWMLAGFVHGVMNSDNINITGESFDYGPYRFLPTYDPNFTAAYFDQAGLYRFGKQPEIMQWNLMRFAECLHEACPTWSPEATLNQFGKWFSEVFQNLILHRLNIKLKNTSGFIWGENDHVTNLVRAIFDFLSAHPIPYEDFWYLFFGGNEEYLKKQTTQTSLFVKNKTFLEPEKTQSLLKVFESFEKAEDRELPKKPVTLLIDEIEALWDPIAKTDDWDPFQKKLTEIRTLRGSFNMKLLSDLMRSELFSSNL